MKMPRSKCVSTVVRTITIGATVSGLTVVSANAQAAECLYHSADWSPSDAALASPDNLRELRLVSIDLDENGAFAVDMVSQQSVFGDASWALSDMVAELSGRNGAGERHKAFKAGGTPFDMTFDRDTEIVYHLAPTAWRWADAAGDQFFLKARNKNGVEQRHNPFTSARLVGDRMLSVTFDFDEAYEGCSWVYNLGVVATQTINGATYETPLIIDPESSTGTGGDIEE